MLNKQERMEDYATFLRGNAKELDALYSDVLISVTSFFRNPEAFDFLKRKVFPQLLQQRTDDPIRVWVLGCSTGQEAYSLAMVFSEAAENTPRRRNLQVFATDLNDALLDKARHGLYAKTLAQDISPERLRRFFAEEEGGYRIIKPIRETVVFARQNLISDPPFSRMDLISCRNLLIYLEPGLQQKALPTFHYALKPGGYLFLGASESIGGFGDLFEPADKKHKIFSRKPAPVSPIHLPVKKDRRQEPPQARAPLPIGNKEGEAPGILHSELSAQREADRVSVNQYTPPGVLINSELQILQFRGATSAYLQPPSSGKATLDVLKMAREGLMLPLRAAINKAKKDNKIVRKENVRVQQNGASRTVSVAVIPLKNLRDRAFLILFEDARRGARVARGEAAPDPDNSRVSGKQDRRHNASLQRELAETRDYLQSIQEQHEAASEELQASNEEVQSANEELQSINEELETSKEELESSNEELTTVNEEMAHRNTELNRLNADLSNFQASTKLPIVLLARDLTIRRFSAPAEKLFNLLAGDVGRPLSGVRHKLVLPEVGEVLSKRDGPPPTHPAPFPLEDFLREVIDAVREQEREVRDINGHWYSLRARPYMTVDNKIDGAVLVLVDINDLKRTEEEVKRARDYAEATIRTARDPLVVLRGDLRVDKANESFYKTFKVTPQETENKLIYELGGGQWNIPKLRQFLEEIISRNSFFNDFEVIHQFEHIGLRNMLLNARRVDNPSGMPERILLGIEDITERQQAAEALRASEQNFRALFELGPVAVYSCDASGVIQQFNRRAVELWGRTPAPRDTDERFCGSHKLLRPDGTLMPHEQSPMAEVVAGRKTAVNDEEVVIERPDGSRVTVIVNIRPLRNARGEITGAINCFYDITGRKQAEDTRKSLNEQLAVELAATRRLQETSTLLIHGGDIGALYHHILEAAVGIMQSDMASMQTFDEQRGALRLLASQGFHPESAAFWEWVSVDSKSSCAAALRDTKRIIIHDIESSDLLGKAPDLREYRRSGIRAVQSTPLVSRGGRLVGMISTHWREPRTPTERELRLMDVLARLASDLIERNQAELALAQAQDQLADRAVQLEQLVTERTARLQETIAELEHFSYTITHDMRAPLRSLQGFGALLLNQSAAELTPQTAEYLRRITHSADRMDALIRDSLQYAKIVREKIPLTTVESASVFRGVLDSYPNLQKPHVEIDLVEPLPAVTANEAGLTQCFSSILANSIKFVKPGEVPHVRVWAETKGDFVRFWFEDNGIGIPLEYQDRIFGMFQQLDRSYEGTGIGLALVRKTAERMDGKVGVESEPGKGSRFWLEFKKVLAGSSARRSTGSLRQ